MRELELCPYIHILTIMRWKLDGIVSTNRYLFSSVSGELDRTKSPKTSSHVSHYEIV